MATQPSPRLTEQDYLALDRAAEYKSEFVDGAMHAMSGGTGRHSQLALRLALELMNQLKGRNCLVYNSDMRVRAGKRYNYFYPDLSVACGGSITLDGDVLESPIVIAEVLSPSTEDYDHGKKFAMYREIPSLKDYLLVHTEEVLIEHFTPQADGSWLLSYHKGMDAVVELVGIGCTVVLKDIYRGLFDGVAGTTPVADVAP
jgi:Uma2 family endonuclease